MTPTVEAAPSALAVRIQDPAPKGTAGPSSRAAPDLPPKAGWEPSYRIGPVRPVLPAFR